VKKGKDLQPWNEGRKKKGGNGWGPTTARQKRKRVVWTKTNPGKKAKRAEKAGRTGGTETKKKGQTI